MREEPVIEEPMHEEHPREEPMREEHPREEQPREMPKSEELQQKPLEQLLLGTEFQQNLQFYFQPSGRTSEQTLQPLGDYLQEPQQQREDRFADTTLRQRDNSFPVQQLQSSALLQPAE